MGEGEDSFYLFGLLIQQLTRIMCVIISWNCFYKTNFIHHFTAAALPCDTEKRSDCDVHYLTLYPKAIEAGTGPQRSTERHLRCRGRSRVEKSVICDCLVQLSVVAELQEKAEVLASINNVLSGLQRGTENERRAERQYTFRPLGQT